MAAQGLLFESVARPLLLAHAVLGFTAVGAATHFAVYALLAARAAGRGAQLRRFSSIASLALGAQVLLGLALYPTYRVRVRLADFDRAAPAVAQLFDFKEHLAALSLALVLAAAAVARASVRTATAQAPEDDPAEPQGLRWAAAALSTSGAALTWTAALIGLYVTARHPVGAP
jgi:hypothetical protein